MSDYTECTQHDLMYDSDSSCPKCSLEAKQPMVGTIEALASALEYVMETTLPYRNDGSCTITDAASTKVRNALNMAKRFRCEGAPTAYLHETEDGVWVHLSAGNKYYSLNLSENHMSRPFALEYHRVTNQTATKE